MKKILNRQMFFTKRVKFTRKNYDFAKMSKNYSQKECGNIGGKFYALKEKSGAGVEYCDSRQNVFFA